MRPALALLLLVACAHPELSERDARTVALTEQAWEAHGMRGTGGCGPLEVERHNSLNGFAEACLGVLSDAYKAQAKMGAGCVSSKLVGWRGEKWFVIHLAPGYHEDDGLVAHEALHYLVNCTHTKRFPDGYDTYHSHELWDTLEPIVRAEADASSER